MSLLTGGAFGGRAVPKKKRNLFLSTKISPKDVEANTEKAELLMAISLIGGYYAVGVVAYAYNLERDIWNVRDSLYFATVTMTTVGYGDMVPSTLASRHFTTFYVLFGVCLAAVAFRQILAYITKQRDALLAGTKRKLLVEASAKTAKMVTEQSDEALRIFNKRRPSLLVQAARRLSSLRISGGSNGSGGNLSGSIDGVTNANSVNWNYHNDDDDDANENGHRGEEKNNVRRRKSTSAGGTSKHDEHNGGKDLEAASSSDDDGDDDDDGEEYGSTFDAGSSMDLSRPPHRKKKRKKKKDEEKNSACCPKCAAFCWQYCCCGCRYGYKVIALALSTVHRLLELFPILKVLCTLFLYVLVTGLVYGHLEGYTAVDSVYFAVITGTTVGYGDVSPTSPTGRWLAVVWLPVAIMVVGGELSRVGECLFGDTQSDKLNELLNMDLSLEALMALDEDGDLSVSEYEFLRFMLSSADLVDAEALDSLHKRFQALDVDGSGSLSRADILDLVESEGNGGSKEPFAEPSAASSAEVQIVTAKRSAVVGAKLALNEAMASASDSTKEFAMVKARELREQHRNKPPPSYGALLAKAGASGPKPRRKQTPTSPSDDKTSSNNEDTKASNSGKGTTATSRSSNATKKASPNGKKLGSPRAKDRYVGFNDDVSGGVVSNSKGSSSSNDDVVDSTTRVSPLVPDGLASPIVKPSKTARKSQSSSSATSGAAGSGWRSRWLTFGKEAPGTSDGDSSSDNETEL